MLKTIIINGLKILVAGGLIYWLINSGKLDFDLLFKIFHYPLPLIITFFLCLINFFLAAVRWETILRARSAIKLPIGGIFKITWIGQFFSSVLPGSVSGDLIKMFYVQRYNSNFSKKFVFASIFIDRLMGLSGLILLVGISSFLFGSRILDKAPAMQTLIQINYLLSLLVLTSLFIFVFFNHFIRRFLVFLEQKVPGQLLLKLINFWDELVSIRSQMLKAVLLSLVMQFIAVLEFWALIYHFVQDQMDFVQALTSIPLGLMTLALPIAPSGLGVGHAIFQKLFELSSIQNGASLFNIYFVVTLMVNIMGVVPYVLTKTKKD